MAGKIAVICDFLNEEQRKEIEQAARKADCEVNFYRKNEEAIPYLSDVDIIYGAATGGGEKLALAAKKLKWFCSISAGVDALLPPGVLTEGCLLSNSSGAYGLTIAEHLIMVTIMLLRRYPEYEKAVSRRQWLDGLELRSIWGSRVTILGTGDIGTRYAERLRAFGPAKVTGVNRSGKRSSETYDEVVSQSRLESVLPETDILMMCLPGTKETENILSKERIAMLPKTAFVINVGRGSAIDQDALVDALNEERLAGAAIDVMRKEPVPQEDPLWTAKNIIVTPHCSGKMTLAYTRNKSVSMFCEDLENYIQGRPLLREVKRELGY